MKHITTIERQQIFLHKENGYSPTAIAKMLDRDRSTIYRELKRNSVKNEYHPEKADLKAWQRWKYRKHYMKKIRQNDKLEQFIREKLILEHWSPEAVAGVWNQENEITIAPLTIYKYIRSGFGSGLHQYLYYKRKKPRKRRSKTKKELIPNRSWIEARPEIVEKKERLGDYESDLIVSTKDDKTVLLTTLCRVSRLLLVKLLPNKKPELVVRAMQKLFADKPLETVTMDNGIEFREHQRLGCPTYFCQPYSSWQKGAIEYANRMIRRYFPKKTRLSEITPKQLAEVVHRINNTPRKCLGWKTPYQVFIESLKLSSKSVAINP